MRTVISTNKPEIGQCKGCGDIRCMTFKNMETTDVPQQGHLGKNSNIPYFVATSASNPTTPFTLWNVVLRVCGFQHIGETVQSFNKRINGHRSDIKCKFELSLSRHLLSFSHTEYKSFAKTQNWNNWKQPISGMRGLDRIEKVFGQENSNN